MGDISTVDFDYGSVDAETASKLEYFAKSGKALLRKTQIQFIADFGKILSEARKVLSHHGDGKFIKWATAEFDISKDTLYRYVNAWDKCLSHSATNYLNWTQSALYLASSGEMSPQVQKKLENLATGDIVRTSDVKRVIAASKPKPKPGPDPEDSKDPFDVESDSDSPPAPEPNSEPSGPPDNSPKPGKSNPDRTPKEQADLVKKSARSHIDAAVRAVDDLHRLRANSNARNKAVKLLQEAGGLLW